MNIKRIVNIIILDCRIDFLNPVYLATNNKDFVINYNTKKILFEKEVHSIFEKNVNSSYRADKF